MRNILDKIETLKTEIAGIETGDKISMQAAIQKANLYIENVFGIVNSYRRKIDEINFQSIDNIYTNVYTEKDWEDGKRAFQKLLDLVMEDIEINKMNSLKENTRRQGHMKSKDIFIVHGHDSSLKYNVSSWLSSRALQPIVLHEMANCGTNAILQKIEKYSDVSCAIILMTADDLGKVKDSDNLQPRARQNVVFEAGYFCGKLGSDRVIILYEEGGDLPGDLGGCVYIVADEHDGWREKVLKEFKAMRIEFEF